MCGRVVASSSVYQLVDWMRVDELVAPGLPPSWNVAPGRDLHVVVDSRTGRRQLRLMRWGLVPSWSSDPSAGPRPINARAESLLERPAFAPAIANRRCLVPVDGFYEWSARPGGGRQPWFLYPSGGGPLVLAGIWDRWVPPDGDPLLTLAIVTVEANDDVRGLHDRMPAVLTERDAVDLWLASDATDPHEVIPLLRPADRGFLRKRAVSTRVNDVANDGPELLDEADVQESLF